MIKCYLIRHGKTFGNTLGRYIGITDESLCPEGTSSISMLSAPEAELIFTSPLKRCRETAELLYPAQKHYVIEKLSECNFGEFENKSAKELRDNPKYQAWVDGYGFLPFPGGENREEFILRSLEGFCEVLSTAMEQGVSTIALVVHGGTIMSIMEGYARPAEEYYHWKTGNGQGYEVQLDEEREDVLDAVSRSAGIFTGSTHRGSKMAVSSREMDRKVDCKRRINYKKLFT